MTRYIEETPHNMLAFDQIPPILLEDKDGLGMKSEKKPPGTIRIEQKKCVDCGTDYPFKVGYGWGCQKHGRKPDKHFIDLYWSKKRYRLFSDKHSNLLHTYKNAEALLSTIRGEIADHTFNPTFYVQAELRKYYVSTLLQSFLEDKLYGVDPIAPSYFRNYKRFVRISKEHFGDYDIRDLRGLHIKEFYSYIFKAYGHYTKKSTKNVLDFFSSFMNEQIKCEIITSVPPFPDIYIQAPEITTISPETQRLLYANIPDAHKPIFACLFLSGQRPSEIRALKIKDVNLERGTIKVCSTFSNRVLRSTRKGRKSKPVVIPIHPELLPYIKDRVEGNLAEAFLYVNRFGEHYKETSLCKVWYKARDAIGLTGVALKDVTRHSFVTNLLDSGVSLYNASKLVGHSNIKTTEVYAHTDVQKRKIDINHLSLEPKEKVIKLKKVKRM